MRMALRNVGSVLRYRWRHGQWCDHRGRSRLSSRGGEQALLRDALACMQCGHVSQNATERSDA